MVSSLLQYGNKEPSMYGDMSSSINTDNSYGMSYIDGYGTDIDLKTFSTPIKSTGMSFKQQPISVGYNGDLQFNNVSTVNADTANQSNNQYGYDYTKPFKGISSFFTGQSNKEYADSIGIDLNTADDKTKLQVARDANAQPSAFSTSLGLVNTLWQTYGLYDSLFGFGRDVARTQKKALDLQVEDYQNRMDDREATKVALADAWDSYNKRQSAITDSARDRAVENRERATYGATDGKTTKYKTNLV